MNLKPTAHKLKQHPVLTLIAAVQVAFILILLVSACVTPRRSASIDGRHFSTQPDVASTANGQLTFVNYDSSDGSKRAVVPSLALKIPSGAYTVEISYDSYVYDNLLNETNSRVFISSSQNITFETVTLDDQHNKVSGRLRIPIFQNCDDLQVNIIYEGFGDLTIKGITLTESLAYRWVRIAAAVLLFALADLFIVAFFSDIETPLKGKHLVLLLMIIALSLPFLSKQLFFGHDLWFHLRRIVSLSAELQDGQFPVRMALEANNGYGYPTSIYYCDIFMYIAALLYSSLVPLGTCYQVYAIMINTLTVLLTYISFNKLTDKEPVKLIGTGLYVFAAYRLVNVNIRAAVGEYTAMAFLPLIIAGMYLIYTKAKPTYKDWMYLCVGMSGAILSHILTVEMIAINLVLLCIILVKKTVRKSTFLSMIKAAGLCLGFTAWFLVPFFDYYINHTTSVQNSDLQLLKDSTSELISLLQLFTPGKDGENYLSIGMPLVLGLVIVFYCLFKCRRDKPTEKIKLLRVMCGFAILNIIIQVSFFPWSRIQQGLGYDGLGYQIGTIQFLWRFLSIASVLLAFATAVALDILDDKEFKSLQIFKVCLIACMVVSTGFFYYKLVDDIPTVSYDTMQANEAMDELYLLDGADGTNTNRGYPWAIDGNITVGDFYREDGVYHVNIENNANEPAVVSMPIFNYRYFNVYDENGAPLETVTSENNCLTITIPSHYNGEVVVKYEPPYFWRIAELISLLCIVATILKAAGSSHVWTARKKNRHIANVAE